MKKIAIAALMMVTFAGASFAQTAPKKAKAQKMSTASSDTTGHKHMHKGTKHTKAKA